jgi:predicted MFS family arabinose efflux permease
MALLIVLSGLIISICMGLRQSLGLFMPPMSAELGISAATFGFSIALQNIVWGVAQPFVGAAADRYGARPVLIVTALVYAVGLVLMVFAQAFGGALHVAGFVVGVGIAGTGFGVLIGAVSRATPPEKRSQTVGVVAAAGSLGTILLAPLGQGLIDAFGWQAAMLAFAAFAASMALLSLPIREPPAAPRTCPRTCSSAAWRRASGQARSRSSASSTRWAPMSSACSARATARSICSRSSTCCARSSSQCSCSSP